MPGVVVDLDSVVQSLASAEVFALDLETTVSRGGHADPLHDRIVGMSLATGDDSAWWIPFTGSGGLPFLCTMERLKPFLLDERKVLVWHNGIFDDKFLLVSGIDVGCQVRDTLIAAWLLDEERAGTTRLSLKGLVKEEFGHDLIEWKDTELVGDLFRERACELREHALWTLRLWHRFEPELRKDARLWKDFVELEMPVSRILAKMELHGVRVDLLRLWELQQEYGKRIAELRREIQEMVRAVQCKKFSLRAFNPNSSEQVSKFLFDCLKLPPPAGKAQGKKGYYPVDAEVLALYEDAHPVVKLISELRKLSKLKSTYVDMLVEKGSADKESRVHSHFWQAGTESGRFASSDPNLQNNPRKKGAIKTAFIAADGYSLISADMSQIELRVMAHLSRDPVMLQIFESGGDIHQRTQDQLAVPERVIAKKVNFGLIYGMGARALQRQLWVDARIRKSLVECEEWVSRFFGLYTGVLAYHKRIRDQVEKLGYVRSLLGRYRRLGRLMKQDFERAFRVAVNFTIQGCLGGETRVALRDRGFVRLDSVAGDEVEIWDGRRFVGAQVVFSGRKRKVVVHFGNGGSIICSPTHPFLVVDAEGVESFKTPEEFCQICDVRVRLPDIVYDNVMQRGLEELVAIPMRKWQKVCGRVFVLVKSVEFTDDYIEMYDVVDSETGRFMANGLIVHNSVADIIKVAMRNFDREVRRRGTADSRWLNVKMLVQVHDQLIVEAPDEIVEEVRSVLVGVMQNAVKLQVPIVVDSGIGKNWELAAG